jgi:hypothetical protein
MLFGYFLMVLLAPVITGIVSSVHLSILLASCFIVFLPAQIATCSFFAITKYDVRFIVRDGYYYYYYYYYHYHRRCRRRLENVRCDNRLLLLVE